MAGSQQVAVYDRDAERGKALVAQLESAGGFDVIMSSEIRQSSFGATTPAAIFVGAENDAEAMDELLLNASRVAPDVPLVICGIDGTWDRRGKPSAAPILDCLSLPASAEHLESLLAEIRCLYRNRPDTARPLHLFRSLVGESAPIRAIQKLIDRVAVTESTVLITGESGTGKEVVARNIHYRSGRRGKPFVPINCAAIPSELLESELFGHEKGAFTGATVMRKGRFELAEGGTLFLDEIGDMPLNAQTKLLRVIQERVFERLGANHSLNADVRIVAATHCNLHRRIADKRFRNDLFYRLNVFPIEMPSLRERTTDIPLLVEEIRHRLRREYDLNVTFSDCAIDRIQRCRWEGNVRELSNFVERMAILYPDRVVEAGDLPADFGSTPEAADEVAGTSLGPVDQCSADTGVNLSLPPDGVDLKQQLCEIERQLIQQALSTCGGIVAQAAKLLHLRRTTLVEKIQRYSIVVKRDPVGQNDATQQ